MVTGKQNEALICWSGGRDSTLILHDLLALRTIKVRTITITHSQVEGEKMQKIMRTAAKKKLVAKYGDFVSDEVTIDSSGAGIPSGGCVQPMLWIPLAALHLKAEEDLYLGYVRGDDVWHYRTQIYELFRQSQALLYKSGELVCPLEWITKKEIITELDRIDLLKSTWYCQTDRLDTCGTCASCIINEMTMDYINKKKKSAKKLRKKS